MRKTYVVTLRSVTVAVILAVAISVVRQNFILWMPFYQR